MNKEDFPTLEKVKASIERLKKKEFPKYVAGTDVESFVKEVSAGIFDEFDFVINAAQPMKCNRPFLDFYRVRPFDAFKNIDLIREHSYPPMEIVGMGRCNFPNYPVFYCSNNAGTALLEVVRNIKGNSQKYCISKWKLIPTEEDLFFESFLQVQLPEENFFNLLKDNFSEKVKEPFEKEFKQPISLDQQDGLLEYFKYLHNCFVQDKNYSLSATLAHRTLYAPHNFRTDVLMYPSVQSLFKGVNLALNPNFVENNLKLCRLYIVDFELFNPQKGEIRITITKYAEVEKNVIMWKNIHPENEEYKKFINEDFGEMLESEYRKEK